MQAVRKHKDCAAQVSGRLQVASAPSKRKKSETVVSDVDTETDETEEWKGEREDDKENRAMVSDSGQTQAALRAVYNTMQDELRGSGSTRVLDKRITSALWAARQPLQALDNTSNVVG